MKNKCVSTFFMSGAFTSDNQFARADNGKMRAANESYALKMNIIVIF